VPALWWWGNTEYCDYPAEAVSITKVGGYSADSMSIETIRLAGTRSGIGRKQNGRLLAKRLVIESSKMPISICSSHCRHNLLRISIDNIIAVVGKITKRMPN
jgi:hypothetical protein